MEARNSDKRTVLGNYSTLLKVKNLVSAGVAGVLIYAERKGPDCVGWAYLRTIEFLRDYPRVGNTRIGRGISDGLLNILKVNIIKDAKAAAGDLSLEPVNPYS